MPKIMKKVRKFHKSEKSCEKVLTVFKNHLISSRFECSITKVRLNLHYREIVTRMTMKIGNLRSSIDFSEFYHTFLSLLTFRTVWFHQWLNHWLECFPTKKMSYLVSCFNQSVNCYMKMMIYLYWIDFPIAYNYIIRFCVIISHNVSKSTSSKYPILRQITLLQNSIVLLQSYFEFHKIHFHWRMIIYPLFLLICLSRSRANHQFLHR